MVIEPISYDKAVEFIRNDDTHKLPHSDLVEMEREFRCLDFGITFKHKANSAGIKCAIIFIHTEDRLWNIKTGGHVLNAIAIDDGSIIYIEPQSGVIIGEPKVGSNLQLLLYEAIEKVDLTYDRNLHGGDDIGSINAHTICDTAVVW